MHLWIYFAIYMSSKRFTILFLE